eukprot:8055006-Pyramimonas_sp.AAC.1
MREHSVVSPGVAFSRCPSFCCRGAPVVCRALVFLLLLLWSDVLLSPLVLCCCAVIMSAAVDCVL